MKIQIPTNIVHDPGAKKSWLEGYRNIKKVIKLQAKAKKCALASTYSMAAVTIV